MKEPVFLKGSYAERTGEQTREYFDQWSKVYDEELTGNDYRQPQRCAAALTALLADRGARVLDAGCGTGLSGMAIAQAGYRLIDGCDFSLGMLEKAFSRGVYSKTFVADLNQVIDAPDGAYGAVTAVGVFSFGHVKPEALNELLRVAAPQAPVIIGLNDKFFQQGSLMAKLEALAAEARLALISVEHGEHIPGIDLTGWVISARKL